MSGSSSEQYDALTALPVVLPMDMPLFDKVKERRF